MCLVMLQLVQVLIFVAWVQLSQNKLARITVHWTLYVLLYCNTSHATLYTSVPDVAGIVSFLGVVIQEYARAKDTFSTKIN